MGLLDKIFGTYSQRELKKIYPIRDKVLALDEPYQKLSDAELRANTDKLKARLANGETLDVDDGLSLDDADLDDDLLDVKDDFSDDMDDFEE